MKIIHKNKVSKDLSNQGEITLDYLQNFELLYRKSRLKLFRISYNLVGDTKVAEGIVHDAFCDIWSRRKSLEINTSLEAYIVRAVKFSSIDYLRARAVRLKAKEELLATSRISHNDTEENVIANDLKSGIDQLIGQLPKRCQEVFRLKREKFMTNKDIALGLNISEKAVEKHMTRAIRFLRAGIRGAFLFIFILG
ncbi:MAG: RNA polymerase sigma-70 factor [Bacteroidota bacterium]